MRQDETIRSLSAVLRPPRVDFGVVARVIGRDESITEPGISQGIALESFNIVLKY